MCKKKEVIPPKTKSKKMQPPTAKGCRRRRRTQTNNNKSLIKTISLLFTICGTASLIALQYINPTAKTQLITKLSKIELKHTISNISSALQDMPKKRRLGGSGNGGGIIKLTESSKLFDFDEEMDKSENAFLSVSLPEDVEKNKNPLERVLEGLEDLFNGLEDVFNNSKNNLRNKHRNLKAAAAGGGGDTEMRGETQRNWIPSIITNYYSPIAAPLIAFIGIIFAIASFASRLIMTSHPSSSIHNRVDENEAEIIQFYEKEMECGTLMQASGMPLFSQDVKLPNHPLIRQGSGCNSGRFDTNTTALRRSVSDPVEARGSQGDMYYSRVLETLHLEDNNDEGEGKVGPFPLEAAEEGKDQQVIQEGIKDDLQECQITLLENISSLTEDDAVEEPERVERDESDMINSPSEAAPCSPQPQEEMAVDDEDTCFESALSQIIPEQDGHQVQSQSCPSSPESSSSTISSLTVEDYDIETGSFNIPPVPSLPTSPPMALDHEATTPQRGNLSHNRKLSKRVSFSPDIKIREIPRRRRQVYELSSEMYLYIMLFLVAIVIAVFSFMPPPHPKLSPVSCGEMFLRAEKMLSSQWDVEL